MAEGGAAMNVDGGDAAIAPLVRGESSEAITLSAQADQVNNDSPIKDPNCPSVPDNLVMMEEMTKDKLLDACKVRFKANGIYTFVADILVAINPYKWIDMYGVNYKERYSPSKSICGVPHVYAVAQSAAKNLRLLNRNQVCIISGESGSGKTETAKLFMHHLLTYSSGTATSATKLERQILESQPLLEAFGNAKTGLNDNSSRFGKYIEVLYEGMDKVLGARVRKYLLEKSRVVRQVEGERNFHVFYYLADGAPAALRAKLKIKGSDEYKYLKSSSKVSVPSDWFNELEKSLRELGFVEEHIMSLWTALAAIMKTGELSFKDNEGAIDDSSTFADVAVAQDLADTLGVPLELLENALTTKHMVTVGETFHKPLNAVASQVTSDVLAQNMYDNLFSWLTDNLNHLLAPPEADECRSVSVLDIFGFENFQANGFEQLFINTANEKLQHYFIDHIFTYEIRELKEEGIRAPTVDYTTNVDQVEVLLGHRGIFGLLDEQTKVPNANDANTLIKMHQELSSNKTYDNVRSSPIAFKIQHYAGNVKYCIEGFLEKNRNTPSLGIATMLKASANEMIAGLFKSSETTEDRLKKDKEMKHAIKTNDQGFMRRQSQVGRFGKAKTPSPEKKPKRQLAPWQMQRDAAAAVLNKAPERETPKFNRAGSEKRRAGLTTLSAAFKGSLEDLMETLNAATPHFVRCIKPNMTKTAMKFDGDFVQKQLNYTGVLETTKIRQNGYPLRVTFEDFVDRYRDTCIPPTYPIPMSNMESSAIRILQGADLHGWGKGKTKMFLKYEMINVLVDILEEKKRVSNEARAVAKAAQDKKDAELAVIEAAREVERAKIRAAAEAQPKSAAVVAGLSWQEEAALKKEKKRVAAEKKAVQDAIDAEAAANAIPEGDEPEDDEEAQRKARFAKMKGAFK